MGFFIRKSFSFGPIRMNLSKSGLGFSAGVKGARIGITSQGRSYVAGGRHGLYFRENLKNNTRRTGKSSKFASASTPGSQNVSEEEEFEIYSNDAPQATKASSEWDKWEKENTSQEIAMFWGGIGLFIGVGIFVNSWFYLGILLPLLYYSIIPIRRATKLRKLKQLILDKNYDDTREMEILLEDLKKTPDILNPYLFLLIDACLPSVADDTYWDEKEKTVIRILYTSCTDPKKEDIITKFLSILAYEYSLDHVLDDKEIAFLRDTMDIFAIHGNSREDIEALIQFFRILDRIRNAEELETITAPPNLSNPGEVFYWTADMRILNPKSRSIRETGKVYLSSSHLHIVTEGHRKIPLDHILAQEIENPYSKEWILTIRNRKTPLIIRTDHSMILFVYLERLCE